MQGSHKWVTEHFEELISQYGGYYIAVAGERVLAAALTPKAALEQARKIVPPGEEISLLKVPREEELICIL